MDAVALSSLAQGDFVAALDGIFEHSPWVAERAWGARPFSDCGAIHAALVRAVQAATIAEKVQLICAHPELSSSGVVAGLTLASKQEQERAGLSKYAQAVASQLAALNVAYRGRFGFPFVIAIRGLNSSDIVEAGTRRLANTREQEIDEAVRQIARIGYFRLAERMGQRLTDDRS